MDDGLFRMTSLVGVMDDRKGNMEDTKGMETAIILRVSHTFCYYTGFGMQNEDRLLLESSYLA